MGGPKISVEVVLGSKSARDFAAEFNKALLDSNSDWEKEVKKTTADGITAGYKVALASGKSGLAMKKMLNEGIRDVYTDYMTQLRQGNIVAAEKLSQVIDKRTRKFKAEADSIAKSFEKMQKSKARTGDQKAQDMLGGAKGLDRGVRGGVGGLGGIGRDLVSKFKEIGQARQGRGGRMMDAARNMKDAARNMKDPQKAAAANQKAAAAKKQAASMAKAGKGMAGAAKALGVVGAVLGVVILLVKAFTDLDNKVKELRKSVVSTTGAMEFGFGAGKDAGVRVVQELDRMSNEFNYVGASALGMYATTKQMLKVIAAISGAGRNLSFLREEIQKGAKGMTSYVDITNIAIGYSKLLGESMETTGARIGKIAMETGFSIATIGESFTLMTREAELAGFQTKRFFSTVIEATSGLLYYNVRLQDSTKLLGELSQTLGETMGTKVFKDIVQSGAKTTESALKQYFLSGQGRTRKILGTAAELQTAAMYETDLGAKGKHALSGQLGISRVEQFAEAMGNSDMREQIKEVLRGVDMEEEATQVRALGQLIEAQKGSTADVARALKVLPPAAKMAMLAQPGGPVLGDMSFDAIMASDDVGVSAAFENVLQELGFGGIAQSPEKMNAMADEFKRLRISYDAAKEAGETPGKFQEYIQRHFSQNLAEDLGKEQNEQLDAAKEVALATKDLNDIMEEKILGVLRAIHGAVEGILGFLTGGQNKAAAAAGRASAKAIAKKSMEEAREAMEGKVTSETEAKEAEAKGKTLRQQAESETDPEKKKSLLEGAAREEKIAAHKKAVAEGQGVTEKRKRDTQAFEESVAKYAGKAATPLGLAVSRQQARGELGMGGIPGTDLQEVYMEAVSEIDDQIDPDNDMSDWVATILSDSDFKELAAQGVDVDYAVRQAKMRTQEWALTYEGPRTRSEFYKGETPFEKARAGHYEQELVRLLDAAVANKVNVQDAVILPGGNRQVITDPQDTIMAFKNGGPLAGAMGGGGGENTFNFYINGDKAQMSREIMRVLKATGNA